LEGHGITTCTIRRARFVDTATGRSASVPLEVPDVEFPPDLVVASRSDFDGALVDAAKEAGVDTVAARVTDIVALEDEFRIETTAGVRRAASVVGADGTNSLVRRRLAEPFRRDQLSIATG